MRQAKLMLAVGVLLATGSTALALDAGGLGLQAEEPDATVVVQNFAFQDEETGTPVTTIEVGETVRWTWEGGCHSVTEGVRDGSGGTLTTPAFDSELRCAQFDEDGDALTTMEATFDEPGVFSYFCKPHPKMQGIVVVTGGPG